MDMLRVKLLFFYFSHHITRDSMNAISLIFTIIIIICAAIVIAYNRAQIYGGVGAKSPRPPMMSFPRDEYEFYKEMLDKGEPMGTTRTYREYGKYKLGHIYRTPRQIGHRILITQIDELARIEDHPSFASMTQAQVAQIRKYERDGLQHVHFISVNDAHITYYDDGLVKFVDTPRKHYFFARQPEWHLYLEVYYDAPHHIVAYYKYNFAQRHLPPGNPRRFYEHLKMCSGKYAGYLRETYRKNAPYCKYIEREDDDGNHYLTVHRYNDDLYPISSEWIKNGMIIKESEFAQDGTETVHEYPEGTRPITLYVKPSDQPMHLRQDIV